MAKMKRPKFHLTWPAGSELSDEMVEIWVRGISVREYNEGLQRGMETSKLEGKERFAAVAASDTHAIELFADRLVSWNLEDDDGKPIPADIEGVRSLDNRTFEIITSAWYKAMVEVPTSSSSTSNGSRQSEEDSLQLGNLSSLQ